MFRLTATAFLTLLLCCSIAVADGEPEATVAANESGAVQPALAVDAEGKLYLVYGAGAGARQIWLRTSEDGKTWSEPELVSEGAVEVMVGNTRGPNVAVVDGTVAVTAFASFRKGEDKHLYCFRKRAKDKRFTPTRVSGNRAKDGEGLHHLAVDSDGKLHVSWLDSRNGKPEPWYAWSTNEGKSFKGETSVYTSPENGICPCCAPSIAAEGKTVVVQFRNQLGGVNDMYAAVSTNGGRKWEATRLDDRPRWKG